MTPSDSSDLFNYTIETEQSQIKSLRKLCIQIISRTNVKYGKVGRQSGALQRHFARSLVKFDLDLGSQVRYRPEYKPSRRFPLHRSATTLLSLRHRL